MGPIKSACVDVVTQIDGVRLHAMLDLEVGLQLGVVPGSAPLEQELPDAHTKTTVPAPSAE